MNSSTIMKYSLIEYKDDGNDDELFIEKIIDDIELDIDHEYDRKLNLNVLTMKFSNLILIIIIIIMWII